MEASKQKAKSGDQEQRRQAPIISPSVPEKEMPRIKDQQPEAMMGPEKPEESNKQPRPGDDADAELSIILEQIGTYFTRQARRHDLEAISFSLRHLFSRVDFLYRQALPDLDQWVARARDEKGRETFLNQQIWLHLQTVNRTLDRMAPLCHLLSDVIECLLDTLDNEELWLRTFEEEETLLLKQVQAPEKKFERTLIARPIGPHPEPASGDSEVWERAVATLMDRLLIWQEQHHKLASFQQQFAQPPLSASSLSELDTAFAILLDSAGAIFGDILPNFRLVGPEDREEIGALLFDLMQQSDQMLVQFEVTLEPLTSLLRHFSGVNESS